MLALIVAIVVWQTFGKSARGAGPTSLQGEPAPVIALRDDDGAPVSLDQYRNKVVLMNLWATWCPPCREELPDLQRLYAQDRRRGLVVIGVDQGESADRARAFAQALGLRFPIWIDANQAYGRAYDALGFPTTVIVDRTGRVARGFDGALTFDEMRAAVAPLLSRG
ncbi:MAG: TlpA family protein disulfide reductase [Candidatus Tyrphobacter sp.]